jgi:hypothetical protein
LAGVNEAAADGTLARFPGIARVSVSPDVLKALRFPDVALLAGTLSALGTVTKLGALFVDDEDGCSGGEAAAAAHLSAAARTVPAPCPAPCPHPSCPHRDRRTQPRSSNRHRFPPNAPPQCESV